MSTHRAFIMRVAGREVLVTRIRDRVINSLTRIRKWQAISIKDGIVREKAAKILGLCAHSRHLSWKN